MGDQDVVADERSQFGPHLGKRTGVPYVAVRVAVDRRRAGRDRSVRPDQRIKSVRDFAAYHAHRPNLHNLAHLHVLVCRFQVERDVTREGVEDVEGVEVLEGLEECEGEPVRTPVRRRHDLRGCVGFGPHAVHAGRQQHAP